MLNENDWSLALLQRERFANVNPFHISSTKNYYYALSVSQVQHLPTNFIPLPFCKNIYPKKILAQNISPEWKICQVKITYHQTMYLYCHISEWVSYSKCLFKNDYLQLYFDGDPGLAYFMCITPFYYNVIL